MLKNTRYRLNLKDRRFGKPLQRRKSEPKLKSFVRIPANWEFVALRASDHSQAGSRPASLTSVYLYKGPYFSNFTLPPHASSIVYDPQTYSFTLAHVHVPYCYELFLRSLFSLFTIFNKPIFLKIRFRGKGYYMYKNHRNTVAPQFGYAHRVYVYAQACSVRFLSKTKILLFGLSKSDALLVGRGIKAVKPINIFTGRGVRFARQIVYKKTGKVSSYR